MTRAEIVPRTTAKAIWLLLRPRQWIKNIVCLAPLVLTGRLLIAGAELRAVAASLMFCAVASGVYAANDVVHAPMDRAHPLKRLRPVANGDIAPATALALSAVLVAGGLYVAGRLGTGTLVVAALYVGLNTAYMFYLRSLPFVDIIWLGTSMTLRTLSGYTAIGADPSNWVIQGVLLLSVLLSLRIRRGELAMLGPEGIAHRPGFRGLTLELLDSLTTVVAAALLVVSMLVVQVGPTALRPIPVLLVLYTIYRFSHLGTTRPDPYHSLLSDIPLLVVVGCGALWMLVMIYGPWGR